MTDIRSMTLEELKEAMTALGEKPFRAKQIYEWLHVRLVDDFDEMTNLSLGFAGKAAGKLCTVAAAGAAGADVKDRRHEEISLRPV